jgi:hypothetical protein
MIFFTIISDPMRITKKFAGSSCIGKQVYAPCDPKTDPGLIMQVQVRKTLLSHCLICFFSYD